MSVAPRIPLSLNNLWGACVFLQPETMISALLPHTTAHLSSCSLSFPLHPSSLAFALLRHGQVVSGTSYNHGRLSWSSSLMPDWNGRCEILNISFFRSDEKKLLPVRALQIKNLTSYFYLIKTSSIIESKTPNFPKTKGKKQQLLTRQPGFFSCFSHDHSTESPFELLRKYRDDSKVRLQAIKLLLIELTCSVSVEQLFLRHTVWACDIEWRLCSQHVSI